MARLGSLLLALSALVVALGCGDSGNREPRVNEAQQAVQSKIDQGRSFFIQNRCADCHVTDETPQVKAGPDLSYYGQKAPLPGRGAGSGWVSMYVLDPTKPPPPGAPDHPKVADYKARDAIAAFLTQACVLRDYERPDRSVPSSQIRRCPVTGLEVNVSDPRAASRPHGANRYYFPSEAAAAKFDLNPDHFTQK